MNSATHVSKIVLLTLAIIVALVASSCESGVGVGVSTGYPTRWGGGTSGPPVFVGGPAF
jgi:hypothetical protein